MARKRDRVFALILAILFLVTSVGFTGLIFLQDRSNRQQEANLQQSAQANQIKQEDLLHGKKLENFTPVEKVQQLERIDLHVGSGQEVKPGDTVTAHYTGALAKDGTIFQSSHDFGEPIPFSLNEVIKGWTDGVPGMRVGGKRRLLIPAEQAYGSQERPGIPANSDLVFDIEIVKIGE